MSANLQVAMFILILIWAFVDWCLLVYLLFDDYLNRKEVIRMQEALAELQKESRSYSVIERSDHEAEIMRLLSEARAHHP